MNRRHRTTRCITYVRVDCCKESIKRLLSVIRMLCMFLHAVALMLKCVQCLLHLHHWLSVPLNYHCTSSVTETRWTCSSCLVCVIWSLCLSFCQSVCLPVCLTTSWAVRQRQDGLVPLTSAHPPAHLSVTTWTGLVSAAWSVCVCLSVCVCVLISSVCCSPVCLLVSLFVFLYRCVCAEF